MKVFRLSLLIFVLFLICHNFTFAQTKFDEYGGVIADDESARLEYLAAQLKNEKNAKGTIIIYKHKLETTGKFLRHFYGVRNFLVKAIGVSPDRFSVLFGGEDVRRTEIWISDSKNETVKFDNKVLDETLDGKITKRTLFDRECIECDPAVFIDGFIFRDGLEYFAKALLANPNTNALIEVSKVEYISRTRKERTELINKILSILVKDNKISENRIKIQFTSARSVVAYASFYIVPKIDKINKK